MFFYKNVSFVFMFGINDVVSMDSKTFCVEFVLRLRCADRCAVSLISTFNHCDLKTSNITVETTFVEI